MNRADAMLQVLQDGRPHSRREIFDAAGGYFLTNNAASELRARGYIIEHTRTKSVDVYRLAAAAAASNPQPSSFGDHEEQTVASRLRDGKAAAAASPRVFGAGTHQPSRGERGNNASGPEQLSFAQLRAQEAERSKLSDEQRTQKLCNEYCDSHRIDAEWVCEPAKGRRARNDPRGRVREDLAVFLHDEHGVGANLVALTLNCSAQNVRDKLLPRGRARLAA